MVIRAPDRGDLRGFASRVLRLLEDLGLDYAVGGSFAAMEYGEPRLSNGVDIMVPTTRDPVTGLIRAIEQWGVYVTPLEVVLEQLLPSGKPYQAIDGRSGSKVDFYPVAMSGLAGSAMRRRRQRLWDIDTGQTAWFLSPEDVILHKLQFYLQGGEVADKHPADIAKMLTVMSPELDAAYVDRWAARIGVLDLWRRLWDLARGD